MPIVNTREEARAVLRAGANHLESPPYAACHGGLGYYQEFFNALRKEFPTHRFTFTLCCGDDPALAYDALRLGFYHVRIACSEGMFAQLTAMANAMGAVLTRGMTNHMLADKAG